MTNHPRVRPHHPHLERLRNAPHPPDIPTVKIPRQAHLGRIRHPNHLLLGLKLDQRRDRSKRFFLGEQRSRGHVRQDGGGVEGPDGMGLGRVGRGVRVGVRVDGVAADEDACAECDGVLDVSDDLGDRAVVNERAVCPVNARIISV